MKPARLSRPIFGVIARTARGREHLTAERLHPWVRLWQNTPSADEWWIDQEIGLAIFHPEMAMADGRSGSSAVLAVRGHVTRHGRTERPSGWPDARAASGSATLLYDLLERDTAAVRDMRGQFALALWDGRRRRLLLARDHLGQRCIYLRTEPDAIIFCTELAPLLRAGSTTCDLDPEGALWYLAFSMPPPGRTLARGVDRVPAAHVLSWEPGTAPTLSRYWTPLSASAPRDAHPETIEQLRQALDRSVGSSLSAEGPNGIFLSGGVDSTYIAATAVALGAPGVTGFTSSFEEGLGMNETNYSRAVAEWLRVEHHVVPLHAAEAFQLLEDIVYTAAEPCGAWATLTHFKLLADAHQSGVTQMLTGLGADEIFGGYDHFRGFYSRFLRYLRANPAPQGIDPIDLLFQSESQSARRVLYPGVARCFSDSALRRALASPYRSWQYASHLRAFYRECRHLKPDSHYMELMVAHECQHRIPDLLFTNFEPVARRLGVTLVHPFLDPDLVQLATGLNVESRYRTPSGRFSLRLRELQPYKYAMIKLAEGRVPDVIRNRPRKSFTAPFGGWLFNRELSRPVIERLSRSRFWDRGIVRREWLNHVLQQIVPGPSPAVFQLWALITLAAWYDRFVEARSE
jgi:asparagine synthase (glutamine-hydrolysing)